MTYSDLEKMFNRAFLLAMSKKKMLLLFPVLAVCGLLIVYCRALGTNAGSWVILSLSFLPVFLCSGILLAVGVLLSRIYYREVKGMKLSYNKVFKESVHLLLGVTYVSLPLILTYLVLWTMMGLFYLMKELPGIGEFVGVFLSFAPFLIVLSSLLLSLFSLFMLFFATPHIALHEQLDLSTAEEIYNRFKMNPFGNIALFCLAMLPLLLALGLLILAAVMTGLHFAPERSPLKIALQWFIIMLPFTALMTPAILFFFNFAMESYSLTRHISKDKNRT